jgi:hypothetical protein
MTVTHWFTRWPWKSRLREDIDITDGFGLKETSLCHSSASPPLLVQQRFGAHHRCVIEIAQHLGADLGPSAPVRHVISMSSVKLRSPAARARIICAFIRLECIARDCKKQTASVYKNSRQIRG